jgi:hypothetical protein
VEKLGGVRPAAKRLGITDTLMQHFLKGTMPVPDAVLLKAVDVLDETPISSPPKPKTTGSKA